MSHEFVLQGDSSSLPLNLTLTGGTFVVGRSSECDLVVNHNSVSRRHAQITRTDSVITLQDLGSRNGTFVDGRVIQSCTLRPGQRLRFGRVTFVLKDGADKEDSDLATDSGDADALELEKYDFTTAQRRVLPLALEGLTEKEIARRLHLSLHTVHNHLQAIYGILGVHSRPELIARVLRSPLDAPPDQSPRQRLM